MKLKKPTAPGITPEENVGLTKSSYIREAQQAPAKGARKPTSFVLPEFYLNLIAEQQEVTGQNRTVVVKAALLALSNMEPNEKNHWLLEATKKK
ncbi:CopG family transcriptional regulator [Pantoea agglomerans]|uniref:CopG family transcriptional regulator n=1 Tax=Enterobacter agglomerans TaxID=549 RepID=UPI00390B06EE